MNDNTLLNAFTNLLNYNEKVIISIIGTSMEPCLCSGDKVAITKTCEYKIGDIVVIKHKNHLIIHRIINLLYRNNRYFICTKGDNNTFIDGFFSDNEIVGIAQKIQ